MLSLYQPKVKRTTKLSFLDLETLNRLSITDLIHYHVMFGYEYTCKNGRIEHYFVR